MPLHPQRLFAHRDRGFPPSVSVDRGRAVVTFRFRGLVGRTRPFLVTSAFYRRVLRDTNVPVTSPLHRHVFRDTAVVHTNRTAGDSAGASDRTMRRVRRELRNFAASERRPPIPRTGNVRDLLRQLALPTNELTFDHRAPGAPSGLQLLNAVAPLALGHRLLLTVESDSGPDVYYTLTERNLSQLRSALTPTAVIGRRDFGSDAALVRALVRNPLRTTVSQVNHGRRLQNGRGAPATRPEGMFFRWNLHDDADPLLKQTCARLGIFTRAGQTEAYALRPERAVENCLIRALREAGLPLQQLTQLQIYCRNRVIPICSLPKLAHGLDIFIEVYQAEPNRDTTWRRKRTYGRPDRPKYVIACMDKHFFAVFDSPFTSFAIRHYKELHPAGEAPVKDWNLVTARKKSGRWEIHRKRKRTVDTYQLVRHLLAQKATLLKPLEFDAELCSTAFYDKVIELKTLDYRAEACIKPVLRPGPKLDEEKQAEYTEDLRRVFKTREMDDLELIDKWWRYCSKDMMARFRSSGAEWTNGLRELQSRLPARCFYDFETYSAAPDPDPAGDKRRRGTIHTPFMVSAHVEGHGLVTFTGPDCARQLLEKLAYLRTYSKRRGGYLMIAHNAAYDFRFMAEHVYVQTYNPFGGFLGATARYYPRTGANQHLNLTFKCSYKVVPMSIARFGECFALDTEKEVMPYGLCGADTLARRWVPVEDAREHLHRAGDYEQLVANVARWGLGREGPTGVTEFDLLAYSRKYCELDVEVLRRGYLTFRGWMLEAFDLDIDVVLTVPGLAYKMQVQRGVFENVAQVGNIPRHFLQQFVCGGRVMVGHSERRHVNPSLSLKWATLAIRCAQGRSVAVLAQAEAFADAECRGRVEPRDVAAAIAKWPNAPRRREAPEWRRGRWRLPEPDPVSDYDCTSLYPTAMKRLTDDLGGYLQGQPKVIGPGQLNMAFLRSVDGYFVEVVCLKVGVAREFPLINHRATPQSARLYRNDLVGKTLFLDRIGLEDAVKYQKLEFRLVRGYYFDEGRNPKIGEVICEMFNARLEKKRAGNPIQVIYKLLMNAGYGRLLLKPIETTQDVYSKKAYLNQLSFNYNAIKSVQQIPGGKYLVSKWQPINRHFNACHCGVEVLSMSKRVMHEVMTLAEDRGMSIHYSDTDSLHIFKRHLPELERVYKELHGRDLKGKSLGQFHGDFDIHEPLLDSDGRQMGDGPAIKCSEITAVESLFLGKKAYLDKLRGVRKDDGSVVTGYHLRMKGVPNKAIWHRLHTRPSGAPETEPATFRSPVALYRHLFDGHEVSFDLTCSGTKPSFDMTKGFAIYDRPEFVRRVSFREGEARVI